MYVCIQNVCLYTWRHDVLLWQPYMMQTTVEVNCSRSIKSSNKLNRSAEPNSKLWFRHRASAMLLLNRSTTYELCLNLHKSSAPWLVTFWHPIVLLLPSLLWLPFEAHLCETLNLKPLFSCSEELYVSKEVKEKMLLHQRANHADQKQWPRKINMRVITSQFEISNKNHIWSVKTFSPRA